jgi:hypothetical protein
MARTSSLEPMHTWNQPEPLSDDSIVDELIITTSHHDSAGVLKSKEAFHANGDHVREEAQEAQSQRMRSEKGTLQEKSLRCSIFVLQSRTQTPCNIATK